uniref:Uncharacterized protein n=1 Tax=Rhizophora mucronata TaxID=61149 RepID=A0A2P2J2J0_RHIMU
MKGGKRYFFY